MEKSNILSSVEIMVEIICYKRGIVTLMVLRYNDSGLRITFVVKRNQVKESDGTVTKTELIDMLDEYKMGRLSKVTDGTIDDQYDTWTRNALLENVIIKE